VPQRLASLDILRGLTVIGMIVVNAAAGLQRFPIPAALLHSHWIGLTLADLVFPAFIFMVGVSIAMSMPEQGIDRARTRRIIVRSARLIVIGLLLTNLYWLADYDTYSFRWCGVLQRIGLVFLFVAPMHLVLSTRALAMTAALVLLAYCGLCFLPAPDGAPADLLVPGANIVAWVDRAVLGPFIYVRGPLGYDPEGLLSTLPAVAQGCLGVIAGRRLVAAGSARHLIGAGCVLAAAGGLLAFAVPVSKDLWSASFVLVTSGLTSIALGALYEMADARRWRLPFAGIASAFGVNAMAAYVLHYVADGVLRWKTMDAIYAASAGVVGERAAVAVPIALFVAGIAWAMAALRRRGWVIRL
jgi:predicted acyltransferase